MKIEKEILIRTEDLLTALLRGDAPTPRDIMKLLADISERLETHSIDEYTAVPASLTGATRESRRGPLDVQLKICPLAARANGAATRCRFHVAVLDFPSGVATATALPFREVLAIEECFGIRRTSVLARLCG